MNNKRSQLGFTIIELLITVALVGVIASFAIPAFNTMVANNRVVATANEVSGLLAAARSDAIKQAVMVRVGPRTSDGWISGLAAWVDRNGSGTMQSDEVLRQTSPIPNGLTFQVVNGGSAGFRPSGRTNNWQTSAQATLTICSSAATSGRQIVIAPGGRSHVSTINCP